MRLLSSDGRGGRVLPLATLACWIALAGCSKSSQIRLANGSSKPLVLIHAPTPGKRIVLGTVSPGKTQQFNYTPSQKASANQLIVEDESGVTVSRISWAEGVKLGTITVPPAEESPQDGRSGKR